MAGYFISPDSVHGWMHGFMGVALCIFASLKLFTPDKFKAGFQKYDLLAQNVPAYGYVYPYIELALGLAYLGHIAPDATYVATIAVFAFSALGVGVALKRGHNVNCACMGNVLSVPLSTVTLFEDVVMSVMAAYMLLV